MLGSAAVIRETGAVRIKLQNSIT